MTALVTASKAMQQCAILETDTECLTPFCTSTGLYGPRMDQDRKGYIDYSRLPWLSYLLLLTTKSVKQMMK